jgi:hypothetical protein
VIILGIEFVFGCAIGLGLLYVLIRSWTTWLAWTLLILVPAGCIALFWANPQMLVYPAVWLVIIGWRSKKTPYNLMPWRRRQRAEVAAKAAAKAAEDARQWEEVTVPALKKLGHL